MKKHLHHIRSLVSVASAVLSVYVLRRTATATVLDKARLLGWGFVFLILLSGARHILRTVARRNCVEPGGAFACPTGDRETGRAKVARIALPAGSSS